MGHGILIDSAERLGRWRDSPVDAAYAGLFQQKSLEVLIGDSATLSKRQPSINEEEMNKS